MVEDKLAALGLALPEAAVPAYHYVPVTVHDGVAYVSGQLPRLAGGLAAVGKVGAEVSLEQAQEAARVCILQGLAALEQALGGLDAIERILKLTGFVASAPGFNQQPTVIDAASRLLTDLFGENGRHARSAVGVAELPRNAPVEIEMILAVRRDGPA
jgi:enamine deaminase RidA (YjgF/YER057c/UK114 family)